jgi:hypothetical protein
MTFSEGAELGGGGPLSRKRISVLKQDGNETRPREKYMTWVQRIVIVAVASGMLILLALMIPIFGKRADAMKAADQKANQSQGCECK